MRGWPCQWRRFTRHDESYYEGTFSVFRPWRISIHLDLYVCAAKQPAHAKESRVPSLVPLEG